MIRTWGYGIAGEDQTATGGNSFGVFQFYRHTLIAVVTGVRSEDAQLLSRVAVRAAYDAAKEIQEDETDAETLKFMLRTADAQVQRVQASYDLAAVGLGVTLLWIGADHYWFGQAGPAAAFHLRRGRGKRIGHHSGAQQLGLQGAEFSVKGPLKLRAEDVLLVASSGERKRFSLALLSNEDWGMPQRAVRRVLEEVQSEVPDETVLVAVAMNKSPEFIRPTVPPNISLMLQETLARQGRSEAQEAVFRELVEEVNPEWGKGDFEGVEERVERQQLTYKEKEEEEEEEEEPLSGWEQFLLGFLIIRDKLFNSFRTEQGSRSVGVAMSALAALFILLLAAGLLLEPDSFQTAESSEEVAAADESGSERSRQAKTAARAGGDRGGGGSTAPSQMSPMPGQKAKGAKGAAKTGDTAEVSPYRRLGGIVLLGGALAGALFWRRKRIEAAERERDLLRQQQLKSLLERAMVPTADLKIGQKLIGSDGGAALGTLVRSGAAREQLLLVMPPKKLALEEGDDPSLEGLTRPRTRVVKPNQVVDVRIVKNMGHKANKQGGRRVEWVERLELQIQLADPTAPVHRVAFLHEATPPGTLAHLEAMGLAHHWEGVVRAQVHAARTRTRQEQLLALKPLVDEGLVSKQELIVIKTGLSRRKSRYLRT